MSRQRPPTEDLRAMRAPSGLRRTRSASAQGVVIPAWTGAARAVEYSRAVVVWAGPWEAGEEASWLIEPV